MIVHAIIRHKTQITLNASIVHAINRRAPSLARMMVALCLCGAAQAGGGRRVLQLQFTAVSCGSCAAAAGAVERLKGEAGDSLAVIGVHFYDSFKIAEAESLALLYEVGWTPIAWFDGADEVQYADTATYRAYRQAMEKRSAYAPGVDLSLGGWYDASGRSGLTECGLYNPGGDTARGVLRVALVEQAVYRPWGGGDSLYDVLRDVAPSFSGEPVAVPPKHSAVVTLPFAVDTAWNQGRMGLTAWVQEAGPGRGVMQCAVAELSALTGVEQKPFAVAMPRPSLVVSPNPCGGRAVISYDLPRAGRALLKVYNMNGQLVETLADGRQEEGKHRIEWRTTGGISNGMYFIRAEIGGRSLTARMIIVR